MKKALAIILAVTLLICACPFAVNAEIYPVDSSMGCGWFIDSLGWGKVCLYAWDDDGNTLTGDWPGIELTVDYRTDMGDKYIFSVPDGAKGLIFNSGYGDNYCYQTVDFFDFEPYETYYLDGTKDSACNYYVKPYKPDPIPSAPVPEKYCILADKSLGWDQIYLFAWDDKGNAADENWPGQCITAHTTEDSTDSVFECYINSNAAGFVIDDGSKALTAEVLDPLGFSTYRIDGTKNTDGLYNIVGVEESRTDPSDPECFGTIVMEDSLNWGDAYIYAWDDNADELYGQWPGTKIEEKRVNEYGVNLFVCYIPAGTYGIVINNGKGEQTEDITDFCYTSYWLDGTTDNEGHYIVKTESMDIEPTEETTAEPAEATTAEPAEATTAEPAEETTSYEQPTAFPDDHPVKENLVFTDNFNWGTAYLYAWDEYGTALLGEFPGTKLEDRSMNEYGEYVFTFDVPENAAGVIVSNGQGAQTEDITDFSFDGYWMDGEKNDLGNYLVIGYFDDNISTEPTNFGPCFDYFFNSMDFDQVYMYAYNEYGDINYVWPGMQLSEPEYDPYAKCDVYRFVIPDGAKGIIFNDGKSKQTVDVTDFTYYNGYWLSGETNENGHYLVYEYLPEPEETTDPEPVFEEDRKIYVTNTLGWNDFYVYASDENGDDSLGTWPGTKLTKKVINEFGEEVYICTIPANTVFFIINNGDKSQSNEIADFREYDGYWFDRTVNALGHYVATGYTISEPIAEPTEPNSEVDPGNAYYFYNTLDFEEVYEYAFDADGNALLDEWPGKKLTYKEADATFECDKYLLSIPDGTEIIIISDGKGHQTEDITDFTFTGFWLDGSKNDLGYFLVSPFLDYIQPTHEPGDFTLGDVNLDGIISVSDATVVQQYAAEMITLEGSALAAADTNRDGVVTVADATLIQQYAAEMIDSF